MNTKIELAVELLSDIESVANNNQSVLKILEQKKQELKELKKKLNLDAHDQTEVINLDFYPTKISLWDAGKAIRTAIASKRHYFYLSQNDIVQNIPGLSKIEVQVIIEGNRGTESIAVTLDELPCSLSIQLNWSDDLLPPSADNGTVYGAFGKYNEATKEYTAVLEDNVEGIAKRFDISVAALMDKNNLSSKTIKDGEVLIIPSNTFVASSPNNYEIHSAYYTNLLEEKLAKGEDPQEVMQELIRLQNKGYKDEASAKWGETQYNSEGDAISEDYRNPEGEFSIHGYTNANDGEPVRFCLHQSLDIEGDLPTSNGNTYYWEVEVPKSKENTFLERVKGIGGSDWTRSGPYWVFTGKHAEDDMTYEEFFPLAKKTGFTLVAIFSCGAAVYAYAGAATGYTLAQLIVSGTNLVFQIDKDLGTDEESLVQQYLPEEWKEDYANGRVVCSLAGGVFTITNIRLAGTIDAVQAFSLTKTTVGTVEAINKE